MMNWKEIGGAIGGWLACIVMLLAVGALGAAFIFGSAWLSVHVLPWLRVATWAGLAVVVFIILPLAIPAATRPFASSALLISSFVFGVTLWMEGLLLTLSIWGYFAAFVGLFIAGVGVVPIAMLATLFKGMWWPLAELILLSIMTWGSRIGAISLSSD